MQELVESQDDDIGIGPFLLPCPICQSSFCDEDALWHHINFEHISHRSFPPISFLETCHCRLCVV